jgi:hypothetical protein
MQKETNLLLCHLHRVVVATVSVAAGSINCPAAHPLRRPVDLVLELDVEHEGDWVSTPEPLYSSVRKGTCSVF